MIDRLKWLVKEDELEFEKRKFSGKLAGLSWRYSQNLRGLIRVRAIILIMTLLVFYPILSNFIFHGVFFPELLWERVIFSVVLLISGLLFNKFRLASIIIAIIPILIILLTYIVVAGQFDYRKIGFTSAILVILISGIYHHFQLIRLRRDLESTDLENQLIAEVD